MPLVAHEVLIILLVLLNYILLPCYCQLHSLIRTEHLNKSILSEIPINGAFFPVKIFNVQFKSLVIVYSNALHLRFYCVIEFSLIVDIDNLVAVDV